MFTTMALKNNVKIVIVGGSVAGLSLANMLERLGIDFVLLEAYDEIAPQVGASIGLLANGLRILDQLGCYEELCKHAPDSLESSVIRSKDGLIAHFNGLDPFIRGRLGYPFVFMDRQTLLQVLYNNLTQKSKILTSKRVVDVQILTDSVKAITRDGSEYTGDILVGADGIHSTVRRQMWEIANKLQPGHIPKDESNKIRCEYGCVFGISNPVGRWKGGDTTSVFHEGSSHFIVGGPGRCVYWFLFFNIGGLKTGKDIPRYTKEDEEKICAEHMNDVIDEGVTFGDLYQRRRTSVMTPLQEVVFTKWYFRRIMTIGDAAHKLHPLSAQGGNSAIETAAELANNLSRQLETGNSLSDSALEQCFDQVMTFQKEKVISTMLKAHYRQRVEALDGPLHKFLALHVLPWLDRDRIFDRFYVATSPATKLEGLDVPRRKKQAPFDDELSNRPQKNHQAIIIAAICFIFLTTFSLSTQAAPRGAETSNYGFNTLFNVSGRSVTPVEFPYAMRLSEYAGLQGFYYASNLFSFISIFIADSNQRGGMWPSVMITIFFMMCERYGFGTVAPLMFISSLYNSRKIRCLLPFTRRLPASNTAVLPAVLSGYFIPALLHLSLPHDHGLYATVANIYRSWPICLGISLVSFSRIFESNATTANKTYSTAWHKKIYVVTFLVSGAAHIATLLLSRTSQSTSMIEILNSSKDMAIFAVESVLWLLLHVWIVIRAGILNFSWIRAAALIIFSSLLVGPGATASLVWFWQDSALTGILNNI